MEVSALKAGSVLVVEDDPELLQLLMRGLREEGLHAIGAATGHDTLERAAAASFDVMVIDVGLPDADGRDVCQAMRARGMTSPVLGRCGGSGGYGCTEIDVHRLYGDERGAGLIVHAGPAL